MSTAFEEDLATRDMSSQSTDQCLPRVLLLTGSPPGERGVGQIIVQEICRNYPHDKLFVFGTLSRHDSYTKPEEFSDVVVRVENKRFEHRFQPVPGPVGKAVAWAGYQGMFLRHCRKLQRSAIEFGRQNRCDILFSILESATNIQITSAVANGLGIPKHVLVWDAPDFISTHLYQTPFSVAKVMTAFDSAMQNADRLAVVSDPMAEKYKAEFGLDSVMLRHAAAPAVGIKRKRSADNELVIGFAGSVSAKPQLELLQQVLDRMNWRIGERRVRLDLYGMRFTLESKRPRNVLYRGYLPVPATVQSLAETADILFMPQPFDEPSRSFTELSFPTKLSTYFAARQPVLLVSPPNSSLGKYFRQHPFGAWCPEMSAEMLQDALVKLATDDEMQSEAIQEIDRLLVEQFNGDRFRENLHQFLVK